MHNAIKMHAWRIDEAQFDYFLISQSDIYAGGNEIKKQFFLTLNRSSGCSLQSCWRKIHQITNEKWAPAGCWYNFGCTLYPAACVGLMLLHSTSNIHI